MNTLEKLVKDECLDVIDEIYDRGYSMNEDQLNQMYEEVCSWFLLELYESA